MAKTKWVQQGVCLGVVPTAGQCQLQAAPVDRDCFLDSTIAGEVVTRWWFQLLWV